MTFHKRGRGRGHGSVQSCYDMDADKGELGQVISRLICFCFSHHISFMLW